MRHSPLVVLLLSCVVLPSANAQRWTGAPSPLDRHRLIVLRPGDFRRADSNGRAGETPNLLKHKTTVFGSAASLQQPLQTSFTVRTAGKYSVWVRVGQASRVPSPLRATLSASGKAVLRQTFRDGQESDDGPAGYAAYRKLAEESSFKTSSKDNPKSLADDLLTELSGSKEQARKKWANLRRLEDIDPSLPFHWWNLETVELQPGEHTLAFASLTPIKGESPYIDAAFLTTNVDLPYPFQGEIDATPSSYLRFRIDALPPQHAGLSIRLSAQTHRAPWGASAHLAPGGVTTASRQLHTRTGYTRWYRLQDIENFPSFGASTLSIHLAIDDAARGATEFAVFPHDDFVLRRFDWHEPDGKRISMRTDFQTYPHDLRTLRDFAREHYQMALSATREQLFPLTRGPLYFTNGGGNGRGAGNDYLVKTLRLLGFNSCSAPDNAANSRRYGWMQTGGHYWPRVWMPYDETASLQRYRQYYADDVAARPQSYDNVGTFQIADEPGEINTTELTAPLWIYQPAADGQPARWHDPTGSSELVTRRTDLRNCVLEGTLHCGRVFEIRVGDWRGDKPRFGYWRVGKPNATFTYNLAYANGSGQTGTLNRSGAVPSNGGVPFKVIYQTGTEARSKAPPSSKRESQQTARAALYCNGRLMTQLDGLPPQGSFAIRAGDVKSISRLQLRAIGAKEQLLATLDDPDAKKKDNLVDDLLNDIQGKPGRQPEFTDKPLKDFVQQDWQWDGGIPAAHVGFRSWLRQRGLTPRDVGHETWDDVRVMTIQDLADTPQRRRLYYWSRRYANYLTPRMFALAAEGIRENAPNKEMKGFVALSGHALYLGSTAMPLDMFELAKYPEMTPGVSDWMSMGGWRWDSHQAVAYSVAPYNAGARRYGQSPLTFPMMHCVWPSVFRSYTQVANQCKLISYWTFGPSYAATEGMWSDMPHCHRAVHTLNNRAAQVDDLLGTAVMRPSRVAMLYAHSTHLWSSADSYHDKRAAFLGLSHEYFQPELVTEDQIADGCLEHYDALYVLEPHVSRAAQDRIADWTRGGGLLWTCANGLTHDEYNESYDWLSREASIQRQGESEDRTAWVEPAKEQPAFERHQVNFGHRYETVSAENAVVRARYDDASPAWLEQPLGNGRVVYVGHRAGVTYSQQRIALGGRPVVWADTGRAILTDPLHDAGVARELTVSKPVVMASPLSTADGTVIVLYNMHPDPLDDLELTLRESQRPNSVELFVNDRLTDVPFKFADGKLSLSLDRLDVGSGQMIVVRRRSPAADPRPGAMRTRVVELLQSEDPLDLSAGAWFAGFHSQWKQAESLVALLDHPRWEVRRCAAEAVGRLRHQPAAQQLFDTLNAETDNHARADQLHALALIDPTQFLDLAADHAQHESVIVRLETLRAIESLVGRTSTPESVSLAEADIPKIVRATEPCLSDPAQPVRHLAISVLGRLQPETALARALSGLQGETSFPEDWSRWASVVATDDEAFRQYLDGGRPGGDKLFFALAQRRRDPNFASQLESRLLAGDDNSQDLMNAIEFQRNERLMRLVFQRRARLDPTWQARLPYQLETTFHLGLGRDLAAWAKRLDAAGE